MWITGAPGATRKTKKSYGMSRIKPRHYQSSGVDQLAAMAGAGIMRIIFQLATGGGKTVTFSMLAERFTQAYTTKRIVIAVHRVELLEQTVAALKNVAGINAGMLIAGHQTVVQRLDNGYIIPHMRAQVVVCMVETLHKRLQRYEQVLGDVGMLIVDECHLGNFTKIYHAFQEALIVGFTATPLAANKKDPLRNHFDDIVTPCSIQDLIDQGYLAKNISIAVKGAVSRKELKMRGGDFDEQIMAGIYSKRKHIENCVKAYEDYSLGQKTLVFNCNVEHSKLVTEAFVRKGYNARHIDGNMPPEERKAMLEWYKETDDAILNSVNILNTGFDEPTIISAIINRATASLVLWIQMAGRAARKIPGKDFFNIIDLGGNIATHQDWNYKHDWRFYFLNPERVGKGTGPAPTKPCIECEALIHLSAKICPFCLANNEKPVKYDQEALDLEVLTKGIDIAALVAKNAKYKPYASLHSAKRQLIGRFRSRYEHPTLSLEMREMLNERYQLVVREWCKESDQVYNKFHKDLTKKWLFDELNLIYGKIAPVSVSA